jgi:hypothetical protein
MTDISAQPQVSRSVCAPQPLGRSINTAIGGSFLSPTLHIFPLEHPHQSAKTEFNGTTKAAFRLSPYIVV